MWRPSAVGFEGLARLAPGVNPGVEAEYPLKSLEFPKCFGGEGGIRTHGTVTRTTVFETALGPRGFLRESHDQGANNAGCEPRI